MALVKYRKLPKKPKANASIATLENYLKKVAEIKAENFQRKKLNDFKESLKKKVAGVSASDVTPGTRSIAGVTRRKPAKRVAPKKTARKKTATKRKKR